MGIGEEKSDTTVETKVFQDGLISQIEENVNALTIGPNDITPIEENVSTVDKCSLQIPTGSAAEEALFSWPIQQLDPSDNCSSKMPDTTSPSGEDVTVAVNSSSLLECSGEADNEGGADKRVDCGSETKCSGVVSSLAEENVCTAGISSVGVAVKSAVVESDFLQSCRMFDAVDNCSGTPDIPDLSGEDLAAVFNSLQCFGQIDNEGIDDSGVDICPEIKCYSYVPSLITENICDLNTNSFELATENICSARRLDMMGLSVAINSSNSAECSKPTDIEGRDDSRVNFGSETKYSPIVPSFSRRSSRVHKPMGKTQTKIITRKCPKTAKVRYPDKNMEISFNSARRKRSSVSKLPRSSVWGVLGNVNKAFTENSELNFSEVQGQELQKANGSRGNAKRNKVRESGNSKRSVKSSCASSSCIRLTVRLGNEVIEKCLNVMIPAVVDTSAPATANEFRTETVFGTMPGFSKLINHVKDKMGNDETEQHNSGDSSVDCEGRTGEYRDDGLEVHLAIKDPDSLILEKSAGVTAGCYLGISSADYGGDVNTDPGTSPDSEIINLLQDAEIGSRCQEDLHDSVLISKGFSDLENVNYKRRNSSRGDGSPGQEGINTVIPLNTSECRQKVGICSVSRETLTLSGPADACILSSRKELSTEPMPLSTRGVVGDCRNVLKIENDSEDKTPCNTDVGLRLLESLDSKIFIPSTKTKGHKLSKCSKSGGGSKGMSKDSDSARNRKGNAYRKRENQRTSGNKIEVTKNASDVAICKVEGPPEAGNNMVNVLGMTNSIDNIDSVNVSYLDVASNGLGEQILLQRKAWVCCDDCHKWRRIPANLADSLEENSRWICKDNMDKAFADCSIPQEKSNADINAELELSDVSGEEDASDGRKHDKDLDCRPMKAPQPASFTCIPHNEYLHRNCKSQTIDEVMVCHCKPPLDGRMGCGDECLNRMLNIECVRGTCPCGDLCSNQQFQKRQYAGMRWFPTGKKGYGLQLLDNVTKGQFLIEYVGEVLDMNAYEARQKKYALDGHKHFYFMTLNGSEVIDASAKGNIGRFINHSCDPNCRTEKWMINGEICIGLFAVRDMKKGEEVTFDYNYVRVFGAAAKKCHCGALQCQGYIGGDPSNTEVIVQGDSDEEFPEPVMLFEDGKRKARLKNKISRTKRTQTEENLLKPENKVDELATDGNKVDEPTTDAVQLQITTQIDDSSIKVVPVVSELNCSLSGPEENSAQTEDVTSISISSVQEELPREDDPLKPSVTSRSDASTAKLGKLIPDGITANKKCKFETLTQQRISSKLGHRVKTSRSSNSVKKGKVNSGSQNVSKPQVTPDRSELQSIKAPADGRFESVEVKLNELLDGDGGVSKRKDAAKGYLKLLLLTAASGDSGNGEAIQSNRELSMILDALLKTKSRIVLIDIINKNGLRMLHNIMKKYRRDFKKIPILRKLLKVLEYLAVREILTQEHINGGPPCPGMESFKESILSLTEHEDKQVHQISRSFRDRWIPRHLRRLGYVDRADGREFHRGSNYNRFSASPNLWHDPAPRPSQAIDCVKQATPVSAPVAGPGAQEGCFAESTGTTTTTRIRKRKSRWDQPGDINLDSKSLPDKEQETNSGLIQNHSEQDQSPMSDNNAHDDDNDDAPPGFSSPAKPPATPSCGSRATSISLEPLRCPEAVTGRPQEKFVSRMAVAYGIPLSIVNQFGSEICGSWITAPGIPFYPFPPLPQKKTGHESSAPAGSRMEHSLKRTRGGGDDLGKRYFKQKKWNNQRRNRDNNNNNGWFRNIKCSQGCSSSRVIEKQVQPGNNNCYQHLNHIHHH